MPLKPFSHVVCDADVVARLIGGTPEDVNDSLLDTVHDGGERAQLDPTKKFSRLDDRGGRYAVL
jgi:hypothetical protein